MRDKCLKSHVLAYVILAICLFAFSSAQTPEDLEAMNKQALAGDCEYYVTLDSFKNCGEKGYPIGYGYKYCKRFGEFINSFNEDGADWIDGVRKCLMTSLTQNYTLTCPKLKTYAFETHVGCYLNPGFGAKSFCSIVTNNLFALIKTYQIQDFLQPVALGQVLKVMDACAKKAIKWPFGNKDTEEIAIGY